MTLSAGHASPFMIYLDNQATTPLDEVVFEAMKPALVGHAFGNPSSTHQVGVAANRALEEARITIAKRLSCSSHHVVFTSGATEANALAIMGRVPKGRRKHLVLTALEHPSVLRCARELEKRGCPLTMISPSSAGLVHADEVVAAVNDETALVAVMAVNNEVGTIQPAGEIARRVRNTWPNCHVHVDAVQAVGLVELSQVLEWASSISLSAHKIHGPKGAGALIYERKSPPRSLWFGGGQERGLRSGTQNVAGALGLARALELALEDWKDTANAIKNLRDRLIDGITTAIDGASLVGDPIARSPANAMFGFSGFTSDVLVGALDQRGIIVSTGSACHSADPHPSEVLRAIGHDLSAGTVRFGLSRLTTEQDIEDTITAMIEVVASTATNGNSDTGT